MTIRRTTLLTAYTLLALSSLFLRQSKAQYTPYFFDGFDVTTASSNINFETGVPRQGGAPAPISYETSTANPADDYRHQLFAPGGANQPLQLAEDGSNAPNAGPIFSYKAMVSPDFNFSGTLLNGDVIGKRITFTLDVASFLQAKVDNPSATTFTKAGISIGGGHTLIDDDDEIAVQNGDPVNANFAVSFIEDDFGGLGDYTQVYEDGFTVTDGTGCIGCFLNHAGGDGILNVQIDVDDPADGNPWDGVGSTVIKVFVNGMQITNPNDGSPYTYERLNGGFTDNYVTLYGLRQTFTGLPGLATHQFDNFTVWSAPLFPVDVDADFDDDGDVDGADFLIWQRGNGLTGQTDKSTGDSNGDGDVNAADLENWQSAFGTAGQSVGAGRTIPEPSTFALLATLGVASTTIAGLKRRRRKSA